MKLLILRIQQLKFRLFADDEDGEGVGGALGQICLLSEPMSWG